MPVEPGHHAGRFYLDQQGNFHPNGSVFDCSDTGAFTVTPVAGVAAAGSTQGTAAPLAAPTCLVTAASGTNGVILPANPQVGQEVVVITAALTNSLKVYPDLGGSVNGGS